MKHTYYIPDKRVVLGDRASDCDLVILLVGRYMRALDEWGQAGRYDGASMVEHDDGTKILYLMAGCQGRGVDCKITTETYAPETSEK